ncbi:MAG: hypothetical protein GY913_20270 [Proteobacteria bacterium]|nr:hypothetical protein [Pseudomonadota bacterium]MCP4919243.1 hypothetical protein [Pseudomonadota bacterium]
MRILSLGLIGLSACIGGKHGHDSGDEGDSGNGLSEDSGEENNEDSGEVEVEVDGTLTGNITVQLYTYDDDGELEYLSWEDAYSDTWMFGGIWVTAYSEKEDGGNDYHGSQALLAPSTGPNAYAIDVGLEQPTEVRLYAQVDYWGDGILGSSEPLGIHPDSVLVQDGDTHGDLDITILVPYYDFENSTGGGGCTETHTMSGDVLLTNNYAGGDAVAMLLSTSGDGPYHYAYTTPVSNGSGATGDYEMASCDGYGSMNLVGAHDADGDTMITPMDLWGAYISEPDVDGNPITVGAEDVSGMDIQVPLNDGDSPFEVVPFVSLSGNVSVLGGTFDDVPGADVYVTALKYRPSAEISTSDIEDESYDYEVFSGSDLSGQSAIPFSLNVPANTIVYLWAYADVDGDGELNEDGEHVASGGGTASGKYPTGTDSAVDISLELNAP